MTLRDKILAIVTYPADDGTSGYKLSFEEVDQIVEVVREYVNNRKMDERPGIRNWLISKDYMKGYKEALDDISFLLDKEES